MRWFGDRNLEEVLEGLCPLTTGGDWSFVAFCFFQLFYALLQ